MIEALRDKMEEIQAIYEASAKLKFAYWVTMLSPIAAFLVGLMIPSDVVAPPMDAMINPLLATARGAVPVVALVTLLYFFCQLLSVYFQERARLLGLD